jgi:hypothetical protein
VPRKSSRSLEPTVSLSMSEADSALALLQTMMVDPERPRQQANELIERARSALNRGINTLADMRQDMQKGLGRL